MNIVERAKNIILTPKTEWPVIAGETPVIAQIFTGYVLPLALIPAIGSLIGWGFVGMGFASSLTWGIAQAIIAFLSAFIVVYVAAFVIDILAPNFASEKNLARAVQLVAYSFTPGWVAGILNVVPALSVLVLIANLYGLFLLYLGLPHLMKTPADKTLTYVIVAVIVTLIVYFVVGAILGVVILGLFGLSSAAMMGM
jgi:hypothetical protein